MIIRRVKFQPRVDELLRLGLLIQMYLEPCHSRIVISPGFLASLYQCFEKWLCERPLFLSVDFEMVASQQFVQAVRSIGDLLEWNALKLRSLDSRMNFTKSVAG